MKTLRVARPKDTKRKHGLSSRVETSSSESDTTKKKGKHNDSYKDTKGGPRPIRMQMQRQLLARICCKITT